MKLLAPISPQDTMISAMAYPFWYFIGPYILMTDKKEDLFMKFHAAQGIILGAITSVIVFIALLISFLLFQGAPSMKQIRGPALTETASLNEYNETDIQSIRNNSYLAQGCASMTLLIIMGFTAGACFLFTLHCASRTWKGEFFQLPFIGKYIEEKYFYDYRDDESA